MSAMIAAKTSPTRENDALAALPPKAREAANAAFLSSLPQEKEALEKHLPSMWNALFSLFRDRDVAAEALGEVLKFKLPQSHSLRNPSPRQKWGEIAKEVQECCALLGANSRKFLQEEMERCGFNKEPNRFSFSKSYNDGPGKFVVVRVGEPPSGRGPMSVFFIYNNQNALPEKVFSEVSPSTGEVLKNAEKIAKSAFPSIGEFRDSIGYRLNNSDENNRPSFRARLLR